MEGDFRLSGEKLAEYKLDAPPAWDGVAVASGVMSCCYNGSRFFSVFNSGPTLRRLYVTLYLTKRFSPGARAHDQKRG